MKKATTLPLVLYTASFAASTLLAISSAQAYSNGTGSERVFGGGSGYSRLHGGRLKTGKSGGNAPWHPERYTLDEHHQSIREELKASLRVSGSKEEVVERLYADAPSWSAVSDDLPTEDKPLFFLASEAKRKLESPDTQVHASIAGLDARQLKITYTMALRKLLGRVTIDSELWALYTYRTDWATQTRFDWWTVPDTGQDNSREIPISGAEGAEVLNRSLRVKAMIDGLLLTPGSAVELESREPQGQNDVWFEYQRLKTRGDLATLNAHLQIILATPRVQAMLSAAGSTE
jgi:hypothetical protein